VGGSKLFGAEVDICGWLDQTPPYAASMGQLRNAWIRYVGRPIRGVDVNDRGVWLQDPLGVGASTRGHLEITATAACRCQVPEWLRRGSIAEPSIFMICSRS
jgi:hypothetical protein